MKHLTNRVHRLNTTLVEAYKVEENILVAREIEMIAEEVQRLVCLVDATQNLNVANIDMLLDNLEEQFNDIKTFNNN